MKAVRFRNVPAYVHARGLEAAGRTVDVAFGGAFYAFLEERVAPDRVDAADRARSRRSRPTSSATTRSSIRGSRSCATSTASSSGSTRTTARRPCSGTSPCSPTARSTARRAGARRRRGWRCSTCPSCCTCSIIGTEFRAWIVDRAEVDGRAAVITEVEGSAHRTGAHEFVLEPADDLGTGFLLR